MLLRSLTALSTVSTTGGGAAAPSANSVATRRRDTGRHQPQRPPGQSGPRGTLWVGVRPHHRAPPGRGEEVRRASWTSCASRPPRSSSGAVAGVSHDYRRVAAEEV